MKLFLLVAYLLMAVWTTWSLLLTIASVGKPRKPISGALAATTTVVGSMMIALFVTAAIEIWP